MLKSTLVALLSLCLLLAGCTTTRTVALTSPAGEVAPDVAAGDTVVVTLKSGEVLRIKVESVNATTLTGRTMDGAHKGTITQLALTNVQSMQVRKISGWRTGGLAVGVVAAVVVVVVGALIIGQCGTNGDCEGD